MFDPATLIMGAVFGLVIALIGRAYGVPFQWSWSGLAMVVVALVSLAALEAVARALSSDLLGFFAFPIALVISYVFLMVIRRTRRPRKVSSEASL